MKTSKYILSGVITAITSFLMWGIAMARPGNTINEANVADLDSTKTVKHTSGKTVNKQKKKNDMVLISDSTAKKHHLKK
jgi:hypothetical protein